MLYATIFLVAFILLAGVALYLSKTIDHGEARFDSTTGEPMKPYEPPEDPNKDRETARSVQKDDNSGLTNRDDTND